MPYLAMQDYAKMYYEIHGEGQPIIFMHGWSGSTQHLKPIIDILKKDYQCICYDQRGHGASSRPTKGLTLPQLGRDLRELIEYLDLHDVFWSATPWAVQPFTVMCSSSAVIESKKLLLLI